MEEILPFVEPKVTNEMTSSLTKPFTNEEVQLALFEMDDTKAPDPNDTPALFFKKFWSIVGMDVTFACLIF